MTDPFAYLLEQTNTCPLCYRGFPFHEWCIGPAWCQGHDGVDQPKHDEIYQPKHRKAD